MAHLNFGEKIENFFAGKAFYYVVYRNSAYFARFDSSIRKRLDQLEFQNSPMHCSLTICNFMDALAMVENLRANQ